MPESNVTPIKIFISSTRRDLNQYREEALEIIRNNAGRSKKEVQLDEISMEKEPQSGDQEFAVAVSKRWVEEADWVVVIVGFYYGTISDEEGADGLSVTEWEYRHAMQQGKKVFVFMAGEPSIPSSPNDYRRSSEEKQDLKDYLVNKKLQTQKQKKKLESFRKYVSGPHISMFANLGMFKEQLERTIDEAIGKLLDDLQKKSQLRTLIVEMTPAIKDCTSKVKLITKAKEIHDHLHELRQYVTRRLREEVLVRWQVQEGKLISEAENAIWSCVSKSSLLQGCILKVSVSINPTHWTLIECVDRVIQRPALWDEESNSPSLRVSKEDFAERVDKFANAVQDAFQEADRSMTKEESDLRESYQKLQDSLRMAREQIKLDSSDNKRLDEELDKVAANRQRVKKSLETHHSWQELHDLHEHLESLRGTDKFDKAFDNYRDSPSSAKKLFKLVNAEIEELQQASAEHCQESLAETVQRHCVAALEPASRQASQDCPKTCGLFVERLNSLKKRLERLREDGGVAALDEIRRPFDDTFYCVDKRTLLEVKSADDRAHALDEWLNSLATPGRKKE